MISSDKQRSLPSFLTGLHAQVDDVEDADLARIFPKVCEYIEAARQSGDSVYVHCGAGISRAPSTCTAYIMWKGQLSYEQAFAIVKRRRPQARPNAGFSKCGGLFGLPPPRRFVLSSILHLPPTARAPVEQLKSWGENLASGAQPGPRSAGLQPAIEVTRAVTEAEDEGAGACDEENGDEEEGEEGEEEDVYAYVGGGGGRGDQRRLLKTTYQNFEKPFFVNSDTRKR